MALISGDGPVAGGISGALSGGESIPKDAVKQVDYATFLNPHTNSQRTLRESSDGLYNAFQARLARIRAHAQEMEAA